MASEFKKIDENRVELTETTELDRTNLENRKQVLERELELINKALKVFEK